MCPTVLLANPGADLYGSDRMALESARALIDAGCRVVVTVPGPGPLIGLMTGAGATVVELPAPVVRRGLLSASGLVQLSRQALSGLPRMRRLIRRTAPDVVLVNTVTVPLWFVAARLAGRRVVCHVHEAEAMTSRPLRAALYLPLLLCHTVIANSRVTLEVLRGAAARLAERASVVHNAVVGPATAPSIAAAPADPARLLFVGRLSHRKGPHVVIEAAAILRDRGCPVVVDLVGAVFPGNEAYESELRDQVRSAGLEAAVTFHGFQPDAWAFLERADLAVVPSVLDESFGNTAVEAALAVRPLIVSDIPGLLEATDAMAGRIVVPRGDAVAIADAVEQALGRWGEQARHAVDDAELLGARYSRPRYRRELMAAIGLAEG